MATNDRLANPFRSIIMAGKTVVAGSTVSASQLKDLFRQIEDGSLGHHHMQALLEHRDPFAFEINQHGHVVLTFTGLDLTGAEEVRRLESCYRVSDYAKSCFLSTQEDSYDLHHRLVPGQKYKVALMPHRGIKRNADLTTEALRKRGMERYGYGKPLAGLIPRVREVISNKQMEELDILYIASLHDQITGPDGHSSEFSVARYHGWDITASWSNSDSWNNPDGVSVFPVLSE
jgi:hypothetical protein